MLNNTTNSSLPENQFPIRSLASQVSLSVSMALVILLSVSGNILLISAIMRNQRLRSSFPNKLIMNLAVSDFLTAALVLTYQLATVINIDLISHGGLLCIVGGLFAYVFFYVSVLIMVMLSVDRFVALGFPLKYSLRITFKVRVAMLCYPWVHGAIFCVFCLIYTDIEFDWESMACGFSWHKVPKGFTLYLLLAHVSIPFGLLSVLSSLSVFLLRAQNKEILRKMRMSVAPTVDKDGADRQTKQRNARRASEVKLAKISIAIVFTFLVFWCPYVVTRGLIAFAGMSFATDTLAAAALIIYVSLFSNPIIYSSLRADLRRQIICCTASQPPNTARPGQNTGSRDQPRKNDRFVREDQI